MNGLAAGMCLASVADLHPTANECLVHRFGCRWKGLEINIVARAFTELSQVLSSADARMATA